MKSETADMSTFSSGCQFNFFALGIFIVLEEVQECAYFFYCECEHFMYHI